MTWLKVKVTIALLVIAIAVFAGIIASFAMAIAVVYWGKDWFNF